MSNDNGKWLTSNTPAMLLNIAMNLSDKKSMTIDEQMKLSFAMILLHCFSSNSSPELEEASANFYNRIKGLSDFADIINTKH